MLNIPFTGTYVVSNLLYGRQSKDIGFDVNLAKLIIIFVNRNAPSSLS